MVKVHREDVENVVVEDGEDGGGCVGGGRLSAVVDDVVRSTGGEERERSLEREGQLASFRN